MVGPRQPVRLRKEVVDAQIGSNAERLVVENSLQFQAGILVFTGIPFALEILFEEVVIADPTCFGCHLPAIGEDLPMPPARPSAEFRLGNEAVARAAEVVEAGVVNEPGVNVAEGRAVDAEELRLVVVEPRAEAEAAITQIVDIQLPFR